MQFREQGKKIQCIRSSYDPAAKRSHQKVVAAFDRYSDKVPSDDVIDLTEEEQQELAVWFGQRQASRVASRSQYRVRSGGQTLDDLAQAISAAESLTAEQAAAVWHGLAEVAKALRKVGHSKPKRERSAPVALPGQADLLAKAVEPATVLPPVSTDV